MRTPGMWMQLTGVVVAAVLLSPGVGAAPVVQEKYPWFEAKNVCLFRLGSGPMPQTSDELSDALERGWSRAISFPDPAAVVKAERTEFPWIGALRVNLSDGRVKPSAKNQDEIKVNNVVEREVRVGELEIRGEPLRLRDAQFHMNLRAQSARMFLERDRTGRPVMMFHDALHGTVSFAVSIADIESIMLHDSRESLAEFGVTVDDVNLKVVAETPRSIQITFHIAMEVGFVPAGLTFKVHVQVDDAMNAKMTGMSVDGDDVLGPLVAEFMRPQVVKYNNETRQLVGFPAGKMKLRDVAVRVDDSLHFDAAFGT